MSLPAIGFATPKLAQAFIDHLLKSRLENYGYDRQAWRRLQGQKRDLRLVLSTLSVADLAWDAPLARRLQWGLGQVTYVTGQSQNEEYTNLMRQLVRPEARWVS